MSGIKDGTVTFENGRFNDSKGRYSNGVWYDAEGNKQQTDKKSKDYYGLVANFIAKGLGKQKKYTEEPKQDSSKIKWSDNAGTMALSQLFFNSNNPNLSYFLDLDPFQDGQRATTNRVNHLRNFIKTNFLDSFDNVFQGYNDADKVKFRKYAQEAYDALSDNNIDSGDKLILSRLFPGVNLDQMFFTGDKLEQEDDSQQAAPEQSQLTQEGFNEYLKQNWGKKDNDSKTLSLKDNTNYGQWTYDQLVSSIKRMDDQTLLSYLATAIENPDRNFGSDSVFSSTNNTPVSSRWLSFKILQKLKADGKLQQDSSNPNIYYIPGMLDQDTNSGYYYDDSTKTIYKRNVQDIPYWQDQLYKWYSGNDTPQWTNKYFTNVEYHKRGGVVKAQSGTSLWYSDLAKKGDFDKSKYVASYDTSSLINADFSDDDNSPWISNIPGIGVGRYQPTEGNTREYAQRVENTDYYKNFGNDLFDEKGNFTDIGVAWAKAVDANLPKGSLASFYDENGNLRSSWTVKNNDVYNRSPKTFTNLRDYVNYVRNDQILGSRHNVFGKRGKRYYYMDENNNMHFVSPDDISKYQVSESPVSETIDQNNGTIWENYKLTGLLNSGDASEQSEGSNLFPRQETDKGNLLGDFMTGIAPEIVSTGRLIASLRTNNKIANIIRKSLNPVLKDTYERYSPITGAFGEMQFRNRQAADLRKQASRPFTSDASLQLAGQLDANRQARDLEYQGFLADDKEIRRTREAALARQEDNMARRSDVANFNRASINQTNRERAQLEADRRKQNWKSWDNYMQQIESKLNERIARKQVVSQTLANTNYQQAINFLNDDYKAINPEATDQDMLRDPTYLNKLRQLQKRYQYELYNIGLGRFYRNPYRDRPQSYKSILLSRKGGQLKPSITQLLNKIIRNENNS